MLGLARIAVAALALTGKAAAAGRGNSIYFSGEAPCPVLCDTSGPNPDNWTVFHSVERLDYCDKPLILSFAVFHPLENARVAAPSIRACALGSSDTGNAAAASSRQNTEARQFRRSSRSYGRQSSNFTKLHAELEQPAQGAWKESSQRSDGANVVTLAGQLKAFLDSIPAPVSLSLGPSLFFIRQRDSATSVGIYAASGVSTSPLIDTFADLSSLMAIPVTPSYKHARALATARRTQTLTALLYSRRLGWLRAPARTVSLLPRVRCSGGLISAAFLPIMGVLWPSLLGSGPPPSLRPPIPWLVAR